MARARRTRSGTSPSHHAGRPAGTGSRRGRRGGRGPRRWLRNLALAILLASFAAGFAAAGYVERLDRIVTARFEGRTFGVPSRVYSAPAIIYPGLNWKLVDLPGTLKRLGYRVARASKDLPPGQYVWGDGRARIHLRAFEHPSRPEPARNVVLRLDGDWIGEIRELPSGIERGAALVEPEQIGAYYGPAREQRELVSLDELPHHLVDAILAVEDQRFESHPGVDLRRIAGALLANLRAGAIRQGGSTLTQQLVKNFFLTPERTWRRKGQEALMALLVEARYDKRQILGAYLNEIYLGQRGSTAVHGVGEAARLYFGKHARDLSVAESGLLAAIIQSPNGISPYRDPARATTRRDLVLELMHRQGRLDARSLASALAEPLQLAAVTPERGDVRYFLDLLRRQLAEAYSGEVLTSEGLRVYSTLDRRVQRLAAIALEEGLDRLEEHFPQLKRGRAGETLQGCLVALRPQTGEILALVGGRDYGASQFDRCSQARRPTGSVFKPFVYIAALEPVGGGSVITLASHLEDSPLEIQTPSGLWRPENYDHVFHGRVPVREALEHSYNVATARLATQVGIRRVADVAARLGVTSPLPLVPSLALGAADVSPLEIARAYATIASGGVRPRTQAIEDLVDPDGRTLERRALRVERVLDAGTARLATSLLEGVAERGTARAVRHTGLRGPIAAKTGTSDQERDLWFVGFTPELVAVVWIGFDEPRSLGIPSSVGALPVWRRLVEELTGGTIRGAFAQPPSVVELEIEPATGAVAVEGCPDSRLELFIAGTEPTEICPSGGVARALATEEVRTLRRPPSFFEWLKGNL